MRSPKQIPARATYQRKGTMAGNPMKVSINREWLPVAEKLGVAREASCRRKPQNKVPLSLSHG